MVSISHCYSFNINCRSGMKMDLAVNTNTSLHKSLYPAECLRVIYQIPLYAQKEITCQTDQYLVMLSSKTYVLKTK